MASKWELRDNLRAMIEKFNQAIDELDTLQNNSLEINEATARELNRINLELNSKLQSVSKEDVGLSDVDNTADVDKPISTAQQQALDDLEQLIEDLTSVVDDLKNNMVDTEETDETEVFEDPGLSQPIRDFIADKIQEMEAVEGITNYGIAKQNILGVVKASEEVLVDPTTGKMSVAGLAQLKQNMETLLLSSQQVEKDIEKLQKNQGDIKQLQTRGRNIVAAINEVFQLGSETKTRLVETLTAMNIECSTNNTWEELFNLILSIEGVSTANATMIASDLLQTKTGYGAEGILEGTMPDRSKLQKDGGSGQEAVSLDLPLVMTEGTMAQFGTFGVNSKSRQMLILRAPEGFYGFDSRVYIEAAELAQALGITPDKIVSGNTICGIIGEG